MKIAVTYDNGQIFQHFGHTQFFKLYTVEENKVVSSEILDCGEFGHEALAGLIYNHGVTILICGGMGLGAQMALKQAGIEVHAGVQGEADAAVTAFLNGELVSTSEANCSGHDHSHEEGHACGHHHDHENGHACGHHGNGGCGHHQ